MCEDDRKAVQTSEPSVERVEQKNSQWRKKKVKGGAKRNDAVMRMGKRWHAHQLRDYGTRLPRFGGANGLSGTPGGWKKPEQNRCHMRLQSKRAGSPG